MYAAYFVSMAFERRFKPLLRKRLTQSETKFVPRLDASPVKVAIVDKDALGKVILERLEHSSAVVGNTLANRIRQLSVGVRRAPEDINQRIASLLRPEPSPHDGLDAGLREDRLEDDGSDAVHHDHDVIIHRRRGLDELVAVVPRVQRVAVANVAVDGDVALARVRRDEDERRVRTGGRRSALLRVVGAAGGYLCAVLLRPLPDRVERRDKVGVVYCAGTPSHAEGAVVAAAVVAGVDAGRVVHGRGPDDGDLLGRLEREDGAVVLEQHDAVPRRGAYVVLMRALDVGREVDGRVLALVLAEEVPRREDPADLIFDGGQRDGAVLHDRLELRAPPHGAGIVVVVGARHHHVQPGLGAADGARGGVPIRHDVSRETQLFFEELGHDGVVLAGPGAVDLVVGAHDRGDVGVDGLGKGPEVELVHFSVADVAADCLAV